MFSFDKPTTRHYKYYFLGIPEPIIIEAFDEQTARRYIDDNLPRLPEPYKSSRIIGQTVTVPAFGVSERDIEGTKYVWVGKKHTKTGWIPKKDFKDKFGK